MLLATFVEGLQDNGIINVFGVILIICMLLPNIFYGIKSDNINIICNNKIINFLEQIGRYGCIFLMIFNIGILEYGFVSKQSEIIYFIVNVILLLAYWICWIVYFTKEKMVICLLLAIIPTVQFLVSGLTMRHIPLVFLSVIFGIGHIYITYYGAVCRIRNVENDK